MGHVAWYVQFQVLNYLENAARLNNLLFARVSKALQNGRRELAILASKIRRVSSRLDTRN